MTNPIFAHRHYEALARYCAELAVDNNLRQSGYNDPGQQAIEATITKLVKLFSVDNPKFKRELFNKRVHQIIIRLDPSCDYIWEF